MPDGELESKFDVVSTPKVYPRSITIGGIFALIIDALITVATGGGIIAALIAFSTATPFAPTWWLVVALVFVFLDHFIRRLSKILHPWQNYPTVSAP